MANSLPAQASLDQHCYAPGDSLTLRMMVTKKSLNPDFKETNKVENTTSVPVVLASLNLVARAKAFPLRIQNKPSTYKTKWRKGSDKSCLRYDVSFLIITPHCRNSHSRFWRIDRTNFLYRSIPMSSGVLVLILTSFHVYLKVFQKVLVQPTTFLAVTYQLLRGIALSSSPLLYRQLHWCTVGTFWLPSLSIHLNIYKVIVSFVCMHVLL